MMVAFIDRDLRITRAEGFGVPHFCPFLDHDDSLKLFLNYTWMALMDEK